MGTQTHQQQSEAYALTMASTPASNLTFWNEAYGELGMEYPVSADALAIVRNGMKVKLRQLTPVIINHRIKACEA